MRIALAIALIALGPVASAQESITKNTIETPSAFINVINTTGLDGDTTVEYNLVKENATPVAVGSQSGKIAVTPGTITLKVSHPSCPANEEQKLTLKANEQLNVVIHANIKPGENGAPSTAKLALLPLQHLPSPGKNTLSLLNCDALGQLQTLALNGAEQTLPHLQPVHLKELAPAEAYTITIKGKEVMAPYEPLSPDHAYLVVYTHLESRQLEGVVVTDRKPGTQEEELELKKKEVAKKIERERKAAEWVLKELDRKTQERTEARAKRQKERAAELKR